MLVCDYLKFTFKPERLPYVDREAITKKLESGHSDEEGFWRLTDFDFFLEVFPEIKAHIDDFMIVDSARYYKRRHCFNDSCYIYDDDGFMGKKGVNVEFPSHGLHLLKEWFNLEDDPDYFRSIIALLVRRGCSFSRIDTCLDVPIDECTVKPIDFLVWSANGQLKSHYRNIIACANDSKDFVIKLLRDGQGGATFYLGDRRHQIFRCYDKNVESKGQNASIRFEIESHREKAQQIVDQYLEHDFDFVALMLSMFDVLAYTGDGVNRSRIPRDDTWNTFINSCLTKSEDNIVVPAKKVPPSIYAKQAWALNIYNSLLTLEYIDPGFRFQLLQLRNEFIPSEKAVKMKEYLKNIDQ